MSKELEALERGIVEFEKDLKDDCNNEWLKRVVAGMKKCYQRLEAIDNANPSEALEKFDYIGNDIKFAYDDDYVSYDYTDDVEYIKKALLKAQEQDFNYKNIVLPFFNELVNLFGNNDTDEMLDKIKEQKKVLEIIKPYLRLVNNYLQVKAIFYDDLWMAVKEIEDEEEFNLLKRYFK